MNCGGDGGVHTRVCVGRVRNFWRIFKEKPRFINISSYSWVRGVWIIEKLGGREEDAFCLGGCTISSNLHFKTKVGKVAVHEGKSFDQGITGRKGEGTIINIQELVDFVGGELVGGVHARSMAAHTASFNFIIWSVSHGKYFDISLSPSRLKGLSRR